MSTLNPELFSCPDPSYEGAREHSEKLDQLFGFEIAAIETKLLEEARLLNPEGNHKTWGQSLHGGNQTWVGLSHQTLQTPYHELDQMCKLLDPAAGSTFVDLGAGYGRMGFILHAFYPEVNFLGYEFVLERVEEGQRVLKKMGCNRSELKVQDLTDPSFQLPVAEYYFIYDYGTVSHIRKTLSQLEELAYQKNFKVIARGKGTRSLIQYEHPWLSQVYPPIYEENYTIFSMSQEI